MVVEEVPILHQPRRPSPRDMQMLRLIRVEPIPQKRHGPHGETEHAERDKRQALAAGDGGGGGGECCSQTRGVYRKVGRARSHGSTGGGTEITQAPPYVNHGSTTQGRRSPRQPGSTHAPCSFFLTRKRENAKKNPSLCPRDFLNVHRPL